MLQRPCKTTLYRLGDIVTGHLPCSCSKTYPNSIAASYCKRTNPRKTYNLQALNKSIPFINTAQDRCYVHLRLGDVIDKNDLSVTDLLCGKGDAKKRIGSDSGYKTRGYVKGIPYYERVLKSLPTHITQIFLIGGTHKKITMKRSIMYTEQVKRFFEQKGYNVIVQITVSPNYKKADKDFTLLCNAKHFIPGGGGYSQFASDIVKMRNGIVYK
jgi:hypothetical protein